MSSAIQSSSVINATPHPVVAGTGLKVYLKSEAYHPGNVVEGAVELTVATGQALVYNSIRLTISGKERTRHWLKRKEDGKDVKFEDAERNLLFKEVVVLAGEMVTGGLDAARHTAPEGVYRYPFAYKLPLSLPPNLSESFAGSSEKKPNFAEILYQVKAVAVGPVEPNANMTKVTSGPNFFLNNAQVEAHDADERKRKLPNIFKFQRYFHVICPMPLSQYENAKPVSSEAALHLSRGCCRAGGNQIQYLDIDRTVVALDRDNLQVVLNIDNRVAKCPVTGLRLKLLRKFTYRCNAFIETSEEELVSKETFDTPIGKREKGVMGGICPIPLKTIPSFRSFNLACSYTLVVKVLMEGSGKNTQEQHFPVTLVQTVDETNTAPRLLFKDNAYPTAVLTSLEDRSYVAPKSVPVALAHRPLPEGVRPRAAGMPPVRPTEALDAKCDPKLLLPSAAWQGIEGKELLRPHVNGVPITYDRTNFTGGQDQRQRDVYLKSTTVNFHPHHVAGVTAAPPPVAPAEQAALPGNGAAVAGDPKHPTGRATEPYAQASPLGHGMS